MKEIWTKKWKEALIWLSGYFSLVTYAIVGGYVIVKSDDDELKQTAKNAFIVTLVFTAFSAFLALFNYCGSMTDGYYASSAYDFYSIFNSIVNIAKIIVYAVFIIIALVKDRGAKTAEKATLDEGNKSDENNADQSGDAVEKSA